MTETITWSGYEWLTRERWGSIHPSKSWNWYDPTAIEINDAGQLRLKIHRNPRDFDINGKIIHSEYGAGLICCEREFGFGHFQIEAMLPSGNCLWPAWWMYPQHKWPPEIDIVEAYSKRTGYRKYSWLHKYFPRWFDDVRSWNIQSCVHTRTEAKINQIPARNPDLEDYNDDPSAGFHKYEMFWSQTVISFYIDGVCVRQVLDRKVLDHLSNYTPMMVILNNHIDGFNRDKFDVDSVTPFVINYFRYTPL